VGKCLERTPADGQPAITNSLFGSVREMLSYMLQPFLGKPPSATSRDDVSYSDPNSDGEGGVYDHDIYLQYYLNGGNSSLYEQLCLKPFGLLFFRRAKSSLKSLIGFRVIICQRRIKDLRPWTSAD